MKKIRPLLLGGIGGVLLFIGGKQTIYPLLGSVELSTRYNQGYFFGSILLLVIGAILLLIGFKKAFKKK